MTRQNFIRPLTPLLIYPTFQFHKHGQLVFCDKRKAQTLRSKPSTSFPSKILPSHGFAACCEATKPNFSVRWEGCGSAALYFSGPSTQLNKSPLMANPLQALVLDGVHLPLFEGNRHFTSERELGRGSAVCSLSAALATLSSFWS